MTVKMSDTKGNKGQAEREQRLKQQLKANLARRKAGPSAQHGAKPAKADAPD
jgi:hypothetical protein